MKFRGESSHSVHVGVMRDNRSLKELQETIHAVVLTLDSDLLVRLVDHDIGKSDWFSITLWSTPLPSETLWVNLGRRHKITRRIKFTMVSQRTSCCNLLSRRCYGSSAVFKSFQRGSCPYIPPSNTLMLGTNGLLQRIPTGSRLRLLRCARNSILSPNRSQSCFNYSYPTNPPICDSSLHLKLVA